MKELSIEEKATRYDRSIERARDVYTYYCDDREQLRKIESIFPELKETKQEWSEKDETAIHLACEFIQHHSRKGDSINGIDCTELVKTLKSFKDRILLQPEQKWSENDENRMNNLCHFLEEYGNQYYGHLTLQDTIYWLKSLKDRVQFQNIITDEELVQAKKDAYDDALDKIEYHSGKPTFDDGWSAAIWYLKKRNSLPQKQWKPSDEQIGVIEAVINNRSFQRRHLDSLYEQLKKLKSE